MLGHLRGRFDGHDRIEVKSYDALADDAVEGEVAGVFGSAVMINVLEHLDDDVALLISWLLVEH